jgi:hypothetical protein
MGAPDGGLSCAADVCESSTTCGNGVLEAGEACEGNDLAGRSCYSQGFGGGRLQCSTSCVLDTSECLPGPTCERHIGSELGVVLTLDLVGHADDSNSYSCSEGGVDADDLTLSWTAPRAGCFEFTVSSDGAINTIVAVFDECSLATELACGEETGFYEDAVVRIDAVANTTYALVVDTDEPFNAAMIELDISACVPDEWVCPDSDYAGDQGCDCGCGAFDPDCADDTVDACDNCGRRDSCSNRQCADLDPNGNWRCMTGGGAR